MTTKEAISALRAYADGYAGNIRGMCATAADLIEDLDKRVPRWISVEERLPEKKGNYLVRCYFHNPGASYTYENIKIIHFRGKSKWATENEYITYWMPLPEPPEEVDHEAQSPAP